MASLEREVNLAHIWPKAYSSLEAGKEKRCCYWFIGLKLDKEGGRMLNVECLLADIELS